MSLPAYRIRFVDSYRYIKSSLDEFTKRFPQLPLFSPAAAENEEEEKKGKGVFPYKMNHPDFYDYDGELPPKEMFLDRFSSQAAERKYEQMKREWEPGKRWNLREQLHEYLVQDIRVLRGGCLSFLKEIFEFQAEVINDEVQKRTDKAFRHWGSEEANSFFSPFTHPHFTISAFVHTLFIYHGLSQHEICLISNQRGARKTSRLELEWISYQQHVRPHLKIRAAHTHAAGQYYFRSRYFPDGYAKTADGKEYVFEMLGCAVHGHCVGLESDETCPLTSRFAAHDKNPFGVPMYEAYKAWEKKKSLYDSLSPNVELIFVWECQFKKEKQENENVRLFLSTLNLPEERLVPRFALRGGRCEAQRLHFSKQEMPGYSMVVIDRNSLYPSVSITHPYPCGQPEILIGKAISEDVTWSKHGFFVRGENRQGIVQVRVLPPDSMFFPILPFQVRGKMFFGLCRRCMLENVATELVFCTHSDSERAITGVWTTFELSFALECGYRILECYEFYSYPQQAYLFRPFYLRLAKMKLSAENWPENCQTEQEKEELIALLNKDMPGLDMSVSDVVPNNAKRQFAKLMANASLGKWCQSDMRSSVRYLYNYAQFVHAKHREPKINVKSLTVLTDHVAEMVYEPVAEYLGFQRKTNVILYAMVTARARCEMARVTREMLRLNVLPVYEDTDSKWCIVPSDTDLKAFEERFKIGCPSFLGFKYETSHEIDQFFCLGSKNYSFRTADGATLVKSRGFTLKSRQAQNELNHDVVRELLSLFLEGKEKTVSSECFRMKINRQTATVHNSSVRKQYSNFLYDKRMIVKDDSQTAVTLPFGVKHCNFNDCDPRIQLRGTSLV